MTEILLSNFEEKFETLKASLKNAVFVAIDTEFSGLRSSKDTPSLFDNNEARYVKMKGHIENYIIIQFGLAAFHYHESSNTYTADVFNIYLFPRSVGTTDRSFKFQTSSVEFLCRYDFDFNKMTYEGLPYVTVQEEVQLRADLASGTLMRKLQMSCEVDIQDLIKQSCSSVGKWLATAAEGESLVLNCPEHVLLSLLHYELRSSFPILWTEKVDGSKKQVRVLKVKAEERQVLEAQPEGAWHEKEALQHFLGFSRVFSVLASLDVPIVGHNVLLDLMMSFQQFIEPLPMSYDEFKTKLHEVLISVIDTKYLSLEVKRKISFDDLWESSLPNVFSFMSSNCCDLLAPGAPVIKTDAYDITPQPPTVIQTEIPAVHKEDQKSDYGKITVNGKTNKENDYKINKMGDESSISSSKIETEKINKVMVNGFKDKTNANGLINGMEDAHKLSIIAAEGTGLEKAHVVEDKKVTLGAHFHEAAWDSFCSGFIFLRLAHIEAYKQQQQKITKAEGTKTEDKCSKPLPPLNWQSLLEAVRPYENRVHITMGQVSHMYLGGMDILSRRPPLLHLQSRNSAPLNIPEVQEMFARYGSVDIKSYSRHKALIAAPNVGCVRDILRHFKSNPEVKVELYSPVRHSSTVRTLLWVSAAACTMSGAYLFASVWRK